mmetsp:Transcript_51698/g.77160  ORF Transcript_51698/g.77160 Transcript_51698/m.77160 type:complete len:205 (+) Transcript_51698:684-1298(+)
MRRSNQDSWCVGILVMKPNISHERCGKVLSDRMGHPRVEVRGMKLLSWQDGKRQHHSKSKRKKGSPNVAHDEVTNHGKTKGNKDDPIRGTDSEKQNHGDLLSPSDGCLLQHLFLRENINTLYLIPTSVGVLRGRNCLPFWLRKICNLEPNRRWRARFRLGTQLYRSILAGASSLFAGRQGWTAHIVHTLVFFLSTSVAVEVVVG